MTRQRSREDIQTTVKREIAFERVLFFSDAIVAIAITLLALDLKIDAPAGEHIGFKNLLQPWQKYTAFVLSFINIASFWRIHHDFFIYIKKMNERMLFFNICWLFFIILLPFSTSVLSTHFGDAATVFLYSANVMMVSACQVPLWHIAYRKEGFVDKTNMHPLYRLRVNNWLWMDLANGLIAVVLSFFVPRTAFFLLFFKVPIYVISFIAIGWKRGSKIPRN